MKKRILLLCIIVLGFSYKTKAQGDLLVTPTRVVFEGNKQRESLSLVNMGTETTTYSVSFVQKKMNEDGSFVDIVEELPGQPFADPYLRIFPRQVTLAPQEAQVIMLQYRRKPEMASGEYRSHLYFRSEKDYAALGQKDTIKDSKSLSVQIIPIFGMSIPVIIRTGEVSVTAALKDLKLEIVDKSNRILNLNIYRAGNISLYGDIRVSFVPSIGKAYEIAAVNGVGVYTNIEKRNINIRLNNSSGNVWTRGTIKVSYISNGGGKPVVYAENELEIK
jgi:hypothetical protein